MILRRRVQWLLGSLCVLLVLRTLAQVLVPLMPQEAYYWMYAQHQSLSYYDHPPMVAWVIGLGTAVFGNTEWGVRGVGGLLMVANAGLMYGFVRDWWSRPVALVSVALLELSPVYFGIGFLATMDSALLTFWLVGLIGFGAAVRRGKVWGWYVCGFGLGGALLSKYTGVFLIPGVGLLLLTHRPWRKYLWSPHPYLAVLLGLAMFWPVLVWNYQHDWVSFRFQFTDRFDIDHTSHRHPMLEFVGQQIAVATPVVLGGFALLIGRGVRRRRLAAREKLALAFALPLLLSVMHKAWGYPIHINWTAPAYLSFIPAAWQAARVRVRAGQARPRWLWRSGVATPTLAVCAVINAGLLGFLMTLNAPTHAFRLFGPWDQLAAVVERYEDRLHDETGRKPIVIADGKYELASVLAFYRNRIDCNDEASSLTTSQYAIGDVGLGYAYWNDSRQWLGRDCLFVDVDANTAARLAGRFKSLTTVWTGKASNGNTYYITECRDYQG